MIPTSGIDVIRLILSPNLFYVAYFKSKGTVDPTNKLTVHRNGMFFTLEIHIEYMNLFDDCRMTIAKAIHDLIYDGFIFFPLYEGVINYIYNHLDWFVIGVSEVEFYFDLLRNNVIINQEAVERGELIQYHEGDKAAYSFYSNDYHAKYRIDKRDNEIKKKIIRYSRVHIYDKYAKNIKDNQIKHDILNNNQNQIRLEFKLYRNNCGYLSLNNFKGNYWEILSRFIQLLAVIYNTQVFGKIYIKGRNNKELTKVIRKSKSVGVRYINKKLVPTETLPEWARKGRHELKERLQLLTLEHKYCKDEMLQIVKEYLEDMDSKNNMIDLALGKE